MPGVQTFYCWVKLSRPETPVAPPPPAPAPAANPVAFSGGIPPGGLVPLSGGIPPGGLAPLSGGIPPGGLVTFNGGIPPHILSGGIPPGSRLGGFFASGWWAMDERFSGDPASKLVVDFCPIAGSRQDAVDWLNANPGWLDSVETYFLMVFTSASHSA